jgi:uncharacterized BrkB/YihY/UPF0761 family membrane protein
MSELEDIKLKALLQKMKLDSPGPNFSVRVMNKIFEETSVLERIKSEKVLGKGFWMILILFVTLLGIVVVTYTTGIQPESQLQGLLPEMNGSFTQGYQSIFSKIGTIPLSVAGFFAAFSVLLFIDRFINSNSKVFA